MKPNIHPSYNEITVQCTCGNTFKTGSTFGKDIHLEICAACHPFYTGTQKMIDTEGRVDKFNSKFKGFGSSVKTAKTDDKKA